MSIASLFYSIQQDNLGLSSYGCLLKAVANQGLGRKNCEFYFDELVDKDDYTPSIREELISQLVETSKAG